MLTLLLFSQNKQIGAGKVISNVFLEQQILLVIVGYEQQWNLTHFKQMFHFYTPRKYQKTIGFLAFSGGIKMKQWLELG